MKIKIRSIRLAASVAIAAAALFALPACSQTQQDKAVSDSAAVTGGIQAVASELPPAFVAKLQAFVAAHPMTSEISGDVAYSLQKCALVLGKLPSPTAVQMYLLWTNFDPNLAKAVKAFEAIYSEFYGTFPADGAAMSEIASLLTAAPPATTTA